MSSTAMLQRETMVVSGIRMILGLRALGLALKSDALIALHLDNPLRMSNTPVRC